MWRLFGWLWKAAAAALLASFLAIWTTGYIVNSYVEALLEEYEIPLEKPPFALSGLWGRLWGVDAKRENAQGGLAADREPIGGFDDARAHAGGETVGRTPEGVGGPEGGAAPDDAGWRPEREDGAGIVEESAGWRPGDGGSPVEEDGEQRGYEAESGFGKGPEAHGAAGGSGVVVSTEELLEAKSRLTDEERNRLFAILVGKVPQEEWQRISEFTEGGLTEEEMLQVQQIVATWLDREEYDELMEILNKF